MVPRINTSNVLKPILVYKEEPAVTIKITDLNVLVLLNTRVLLVRLVPPDTRPPMVCQSVTATLACVPSDTIQPTANRQVLLIHV